MSLRTISRSAVGGYVKLLRLPWDAAFARARAPERIIPGGRLPWTASKHGCAASPAERCETTNSCETPNGGDWPRTNAPGPTACGQSAQRRSEHADERLSDRVKEAQQQRRQAAGQAAGRKKTAEQRRQAESTRIAAVESRRRRANESAAAAKQEAIEHRSKRARLQQLDEEADALAKEAGRADREERVAAPTSSRGQGEGRAQAGAGLGTHATSRRRHRAGEADTGPVEAAAAGGQPDARRVASVGDRAPVAQAHAHACDGTARQPGPRA